MQKKIEIEIPEAVTNIVWRLDTDYHGYQNIITYILSHEDFNVNKELFDQYQQQYLNAKYAFEVAKQEMIKKYVDQNINKNFSKYEWTLDYKNNIITILVKEE